MNSALQRARATLADHQRNQQLTTTDGLLHEPIVGTLFRAADGMVVLRLF